MPCVLHISEAPELGIFSVLREFAREQNARGYEVHILGARKMQRLAGVQHHDWSLRRGRPASYPRALRELHQTIREVQPDVIHLHSFFAGVFGRLPLLSVSGDVPVVYQPHAWSFDVFGSRAAAWAIRTWERLASRRTSVLVTNCSDEIGEGRQVGISNHALPIGVAIDTDHFAPADEAARQRYRSELGIGKPSMVLCLGRLAKQKGQDQLVAAWEQAPIPDTELVFVGPSEVASLRQLAPTQWGQTIKAVRQQADVRPWLWACDALVLPSRYETVSLAVAEAMSCGRPAVANRVNGVTEILNGGSQPAAGTVVPLGDMTELLSQTRRLLADPELRKRQGLAARGRAVELFTRGVVVDRLDLAYREAMKSHAGRS
ncbi:glycosyltransferase [soil metagenome]